MGYRETVFFELSELVEGSYRLRIEPEEKGNVMSVNQLDIVDRCLSVSKRMSQKHHQLR